MTDVHQPGVGQGHRGGAVCLGEEILEKRWKNCSHPSSMIALYPENGTQICWSFMSHLHSKCTTWVLSLRLKYKVQRFMNTLSL